MSNPHCENETGSVEKHVRSHRVLATEQAPGPYNYEIEIEVPWPKSIFLLEDQDLT